MKTLFAFLFGAALLIGCKAYDSLIGHPLHVLHQQHEDAEKAKKADHAKP